MNKISLTVLGSINLDFVARAQRLPAPGETVGGASLARFPGGKGANQALAAARLGAEVAMIAAVGDDSLAAEATALLREGHVDLSRVEVMAGHSTGVALIVVDENGENQIVVAPGANAHLSWRGKGRTGAWLSQLETPIAALHEAVREHDGFVALNLAPALPVPDEILARANLLIVNEVEAAFYGGRLHQTKALVAVTYGARGAALFQQGREIARASPPAIKPVDTTGAGDSFCAGLVVGWLEGMSPQQALAFGCACGALSATRAGAQPSLPTRAEVLALMQAGA